MATSGSIVWPGCWRAPERREPFAYGFWRAAPLAALDRHRRYVHRLRGDRSGRRRSVHQGPEFRRGTGDGRFGGRGRLVPRDAVRSSRPLLRGLRPGAACRRSPGPRGGVVGGRFLPAGGGERQRKDRTFRAWPGRRTRLARERTHPRCSHRDRDGAGRAAAGLRSPACDDPGHERPAREGRFADGAVRHRRLCRSAADRRPGATGHLRAQHRAARAPVRTYGRGRRPPRRGGPRAVAARRGRVANGGGGTGPGGLSGRCRGPDAQLQEPGARTARGGHPARGRFRDRFLFGGTGTPDQDRAAGAHGGRRRLPGTRGRRLPRDHRRRALGRPGGRRRPRRAPGHDQRRRSGELLELPAEGQSPVRPGRRRGGCGGGRSSERHRTGDRLRHGRHEHRRLPLRRRLRVQLRVPGRRRDRRGAGTGDRDGGGGWRLDLRRRSRPAQGRTRERRSAAWTGLLRRRRAADHHGRQPAARSNRPGGLRPAHRRGRRRTPLSRGAGRSDRCGGGAARGLPAGRQRADGGRDPAHLHLSRVRPDGLRPRQFRRRRRSARLRHRDRAGHAHSDRSGRYVALERGRAGPRGAGAIRAPPGAGTSGGRCAGTAGRGTGAGRPGSARKRTGRQPGGRRRASPDRAAAVAGPGDGVGSRAGLGSGVPLDRSHRDAVCRTLSGGLRLSAPGAPDRGRVDSRAGVHRPDRWTPGEGRGGAHTGAGHQEPPGLVRRLEGRRTPAA